MTLPDDAARWPSGAAKTQGDCPACGELLDAARAADGSVDLPRLGDVTICIYCGVVLQYGEDMKVDHAAPQTLTEMRALYPQDYAQMLTASAAVRTRMAVKKMGAK